jgi:serine/threonine protein kinase
MSQVDPDLNLLFGVLAVQHDLIDAQQFADACAGWAVRKDCTLGELLVDRGWITPTNCELVEQWVQRKVSKHGGDVHASLGAVATAEIRDAIGKLVDPEIREAVATLGPTAPFILAGTTLDLLARERRSRYTLTRLHAEGGLGKVWLAHDTDLNREVALKEIQPHQAQHPDAWRRFIKEAQVTGQLEHPNIVPVYELARRVPDDQPFYTMRFVRGRTLRQAIADRDRSDPLALPKLLQAFISVCQAIGYAHSRGVLHRDLKPQNVVLGGFGEVLVLDWGLAKLVNSPEETPEVALTEEARTEATRAGSQLGTPAYMAPEQAEGRLDLIDARTDIYGLGAILFEILTGSPPHVGQDSVDVLKRIIEGETPRARKVNPAVPPALEAICAKAMAKACDERYAKATDLAEDVQRWIADEPVSGFVDPPSVRFGRWTRKHRVFATTLVFFLVILVPGLLIANGLLQRQRRHAEENFRQTRTAIREFVNLANTPEKTYSVEMLRRFIMEKAKSYHEKFLRDRSGDPSLMAELAWSNHTCAIIIIRETRWLSHLRLELRPAPAPATSAKTEPAPSLPAIPIPPLGSLDPVDEDIKTMIDDAIRHNEAAISLYGQLIRRHRLKKQLEYQECQKLQLLLSRLRSASDVAKFWELLGEPQRAGIIIPEIGGVALPGGVFNMIGD